MKKLVKESLDESIKSEFEKKRAYDRMPDLTRVPTGKKSVSAKFEPLVTNAGKYIKRPQDLKNEMIKILEDPTTNISLEAMKYYKSIIGGLQTFADLSNILTNIYLGGAKLKVGRGKMPLL